MTVILSQSQPDTPPRTNRRVRAPRSATPKWLTNLNAFLRKAAASRLLVYTTFTLLYIIPTIWLCHTKLFWDDEFFTLYLSRTPDWHTLLQAMSTGADQHPPSFYYLTHCVTQLFGTSHFLLRLPSVLGFWLFCISVYEIVRMLVSPTWGVAAMLLPLATEFYYYATEARGYALLTGFAALALLSWLKISSNQRRKLFLPLFAFSLAAAVSSHYYAVLTIFALGVGELVRSIFNRKFDLWVCAAFCCSFIPILIFLPAIRSAEGYSSHFWATPAWSDALGLYRSQFGLSIVLLLGILSIAVSFGVSLNGWNAVEPDPSRRSTPLLPWEATALCLLAALPVLTMIMAKYITHGFTYRYAIATAVGVTVLTAYMFSWLAPRSLAALATALTCICIFSVQVRLLHARFVDERLYFASDQRFLLRNATGPFAVSEWSILHRLSFYSPRALASRAAYLADVNEAIKLTNKDTVDRGALDLRPWFPLQVVSPASFLDRNPQFMVFGDDYVDWTWLVRALPRWGNVTVQSVNRSDGRLLFYVDHLRVTPDPAQVQQDRAAEANMLFSRMPRTGPSLCVLWMGPKDCP